MAVIGMCRPRNIYESFADVFNVGVEDDPDTFLATDLSPPRFMGSSCIGLNNQAFYWCRKWRGMDVVAGWVW